MNTNAFLILLFTDKLQNKLRIAQNILSVAFYCNGMPSETPSPHPWLFPDFVKK